MPPVMPAAKALSLVPKQTAPKCKQISARIRRYLDIANDPDATPAARAHATLLLAREAGDAPGAAKGKA